MKRCREQQREPLEPFPDPGPRTSPDLSSRPLKWCRKDVRGRAPAPPESASQQPQLPSVTPETRTSILSLPPELVAAIAGHCDDDSLLQLRLVNKYIAASTEACMLRAWYEELWVLFPIRKSLQNALHIAQHTKLGKAVRTIDLSHCLLSREALDDFYFPRDDRNETSDDDTAMAAHRRRRLRYFNLLEEQDEMRMSGKDQRLLNAIFHALHAHGQKLSVHLSDLLDQDVGHLSHEPDDSSYLPIDPAAYHTSFLASAWDNYGTALPAIHAIWTSGVSLTAFEMVTTRYTLPWTIFSDPDVFSRIRSSLSTITSLEIAFDAKPGSCGRDSQDRDVEGALQFLSSLAPQLKCLKLRAQGAVHDPPVSHYRTHTAMERFRRVCTRMCESISMPQLEEFHLSCDEVGTDALLGFLVAHGKSFHEFNILGELVDLEATISRETSIDKFYDNLDVAGFPFDNGLLEVWVETEDWEY